MARVSAEDCLVRLPNRFALCIIAAKRARDLAGGIDPLVLCDNGAAVTALREIAAGKVTANETLTDAFAAHFAHIRAIEGQRARVPSRGGPSRLSRAKT